MTAALNAQSAESADVRAPLWVAESYVNATEGHRIGDAGPSEAFTSDPGELYRAMRDEYGRCIGKVYVDGPDGPPLHVGWIFQARDKYEDSDETYLREVWITLHDGPDEITRTTRYHALDARKG